MADQRNLGDQIRDAIDDAINTQDFSALKETVSETLSIASENIARGLAQASEQAKRAQEKVKYETDAYIKAQNTQDGQSKPYTPPTGVPMGQAKWQQALAARQANQQLQSRYQPTTGDKAIGYTLAIGGGLAGGSCIMTAIMCLITAPFVGEPGLIGAALICLACSIPFDVAFGFGIKKVKGVNLFKRIQGIIGPRQVVNVRELAQRLRMQPQKLIRNLDKMLQKGWFRQGHLDTNGETLMVTGEAYTQYRHALELQAQDRKQKALEAQQVKANQQKLAQEGASPEVQKVLAQGSAYLAQIRACNAAIPGAEISNKISQIELVVQSIFARAEEHPDVVGDLGRLMDYYLPTTVKLLEAYEDLDAQPIQTENILESKKQIEDTLDTLNVAFEKLLDSIFRDTAWDVSTDISVLHTVLAQEGLTDNPFDKKS